MDVVLVTGGRDFNDLKMMHKNLKALNPKLVVHGNYRGADRLARLWSVANGVEHKPFPANWTKYGPEAGPIRNQEMVDFLASFQDVDVCVLAFPGNYGTKDCVAKAKEAKLVVMEAE